MKITCADCKAVYNISDDRIPEQGIDTVCKKCGKALHIARTTQNAENPHRPAEIIQPSEINQNAENSQTETVQKISLIPCSQCAKEISPDAKTCPHCGAKVKSGIFGKMKKQAGELTEMAKEKAGGLSEMTKEAVKHVDKEQLKELAKRSSEMTAKHSGKIDRLLHFSFRFG
ncbi:MAG: zinc-ribbon domain-containing protein, partial [Desulfobacterales bacterium]